MQKKSWICLLLILALLAVACPAQATLTIYTDRTTFSAQGTIEYNYGFADFTGSAFYHLGTPWTTHGVTYTNSANLIVGPSSSYGPDENVICNDNWTPFTASFASNYTMFGADIGVLGDTGPVDLHLVTNLATYDYYGLVVPNVNTFPYSLFLGGVLTGGEYFISGSLDGLYWEYAPAITNVTVGYAGVFAPLPPSLLLFGSALLGLVAWRSFKKN
jgi:hypothetical protein